MSEKPTYEELEKKLRKLEQDELLRKRAEEALKHEIDFRWVLGTISNEFITASPAAIDESIDRALEAIGEFVGADRSYVIRFDFERGTICNTHEWCREGIDPQIENLQDVPIEMFHWVIDQLADLQVVPITRVADLPEEAAPEKQEFEAEGIQSLLLVPLVSEGKCFGTVGFDFVLGARSYSDIEIKLLQMSGATLSNALDRKQAEEALRESEKRYRNLFQEAPMGYMEFDNNGRITRVNRRELEMLGYTADEMVGEPVWKFIKEKEKARELIKAKLVGERPPSKNLERNFIRKNGTTFPGIVEDEFFKDTIGSISGIRSTLQDITERKKAENALKESEEKYRMLYEKSKKAEEVYRSLLHTSADAIVIYDLKGNVIYVNPLFTEIFGWTIEELEGKHLQFVPDSEKPATMSGIAQIVEDGRPIQGFETKRSTKEGHIVDVNISGSRYDDHEGNPEGMLVVLRDITEKKRLEAQLQQAQRMEAIGTLAGGIAHDFNNILSPIMIHSEMAMLDFPADHPIQQKLKQIYQAGDRAKDMVRQILAFSRQKQQEKFSIRINSIIKEVIKLLRSSIPSTIDIQHHYGATSDAVFADPTQVHQAVINLCTNAFHAMREKGGKLEIALEDFSIDSLSSSQFSDLKPGAYLKLTVRDTGTGITPDIRDKIFEPYFTTKGPGEGTGMGLSVVHGIVKGHAGDIKVETEPGKGTTFHVFLPKYEKEISTLVEPGHPIPKGTEKILLVDDEKVAADAVEGMLKSLGYWVTATTSSVEALEAFRNDPEAFDLIITDMTMPDMTGSDLAKEILPVRADIPVILCTGFSEQIDEKKAKEMGIRAFVMKPIVMRQIADTIREVLDRK
ncbi:PAS domain S-box protein [Thermodesulfobacteriota bacterium]